MDAYEKKYKDTLNKAKKELDTCGSLDCDAAKQIFRLFPELEESEDEKIRKELIGILSKYKYVYHKEIAWLEKQGNREIYYSQNHQDSDHPNGCIVLEDFNGGEGFYKVNLDYLNKKQIEEIEKMVKVWNKEPNSPNENIKDYIGMCLTDADEQRFKDYNTTLKDCLDWLKKQGEKKLVIDGILTTTNYDKMFQNCNKQKSTDKNEPKFKVGDFIANDYCFGKVIALTDDAYLLDTEQGIPFSCKHNVHLWTIQDAKDGDILVNWNNTVFIFKTIEDETVKFHIAYNEKWDAIKTPSTKLSHLGLPEPQFEFQPATKEQRDLLFQKMKEAGYKWDAKKKKLKKIEVMYDDDKLREAICE